MAYKSIKTLLWFKGSGEILPDPIQSSLGDVWTCRNKDYVFNGKQGESLTLTPSPIPVYVKNINCPNCGAPRKGHKCEYCDTVFKEASAQ